METYSKCGKCKGIRHSSSDILHSSASLSNLDKKDPISLTSTPTRKIMDNGPESGDRKIRKNPTPEKTQPDGGPDFFEDVDNEDEDEKELGFHFTTDEIVDAMTFLQNNRQLRGYNFPDVDVGSQALNRSVVIFGIIVLLIAGFGYCVSLSNTGRIQALENEIALMKQAWGNKSCINDQPPASAGWFSGWSFWNMLGFGDQASIDDPSSIPLVVEDVDNIEVERAGWYASFANLFGLLNSTKASNEEMSPKYNYRSEGSK